MNARQPLAVVSLSGGKDSTATALLAIDRVGRENCRFVFADTGNEHELTYAYVNDYLPTVFGRIDTVRADFSKRMAGKRAYILAHWEEDGVPQAFVDRALAILDPTGNPFLDLCLWKGRFPSRKAQFCTQELKRAPLDAYLLDLMAVNLDVQSWRGIRRDESRNRKDAVELEETAEGYCIMQPIVHWTAQQVVDFVVSHGVELNPLYRQGMARVGCMPCINCSKDELLAISKRYPQHIDRIREWERLVCLAAKRGWTTFFCDSAEEGETSMQIFERLRIDKRVEWAETQRGGRKTDWIRQEEPAPACASLYGLCE